MLIRIIAVPVAVCCGILLAVAVAVVVAVESVLVLVERAAWRWLERIASQIHDERRTL